MLNKSYFIKFGWACVDFNPSQITYELTEQSNKYLDEHFDVSIAAFFIENSKPVLPLKFPRFHLKDCATFDGILIATDSTTAISIKNYKRNKLFYYISDFHELLRSKNLKEIMENDDILKFTRSKDYLEILKLNFKTSRISENIVEDFDIDQILSIVKE